MYHWTKKSDKEKSDEKEKKSDKKNVEIKAENMIIIFRSEDANQISEDDENNINGKNDDINAVKI